MNANKFKTTECLNIICCYGDMGWIFLVGGMGDREESKVLNDQLAQKWSSRA
jgi:hypothetical protein